jgi:phage baseplate assembly protein W
MNPPAAVRFRHPDADLGGGPPGLGLSARGGLAMAIGDDAVRQSLLLLLSTIPGERVMRPTYGCHLHRLVFWPNDDTTAGLAIHYVRLAIERFEPRVEPLRIDAERDQESPHRLDLTLAYRVRSTGRVAELDLVLDLQGAR